MPLSDFTVRIMRFVETRDIRILEADYKLSGAQMDTSFRTLSLAEQVESENLDVS